MSGKPTGSWVLVVAAVVISPPGPRAIPKPDFAHWLRMGALRNLAESKGRQKPKTPSQARSKFRRLIMKIGGSRGFWKAALRITPLFCQQPFKGPSRGGWHFRLPLLLMSGRLRTDGAPAQEA